VSAFCTQKSPFYRKVPHGSKGRAMANTRAKCTNCKGYFPQPTFFYSNALQRFCTEKCFTEHQTRKTPSKTAVKAKKAMKRSAPPKIPVQIRIRIKQRDGFCCRWCGKPGQEVHHIHYRSEGGENEDSNLIYLCMVCHAKAHSSKEAYKPLLLATIWLHYMEGRQWSVPAVARYLGRQGLLTPLQMERMAS
jgi:5-methylcytosine-specific restriction endonuclease McrA